MLVFLEFYVLGTSNFRLSLIGLYLKLLIYRQTWSFLFSLAFHLSSPISVTWTFIC